MLTVELRIDAVPVAKGVVPARDPAEARRQISVRLEPSEVALRDHYYYESTCVEVILREE